MDTWWVPVAERHGRLPDASSLADITRAAEAECWGARTVLSRTELDAAVP